MVNSIDNLPDVPIYIVEEDVHKFMSRNGQSPLWYDAVYNKYYYQKTKAFDKLYNTYNNNK